MNTNGTDGNAVPEHRGHVRLDGGELSVDGLFQLLSNRRRRFVLYYLADVDGALGRSELARRIATWEQGTNIDELPRDDVSRVVVSLDHAHLPRLEEAGVVTYDRDERVVALTESATQLEPFLDLARPLDFD